MGPVAHQRIVRGAPATLKVVFTDQDGEPATAAGDVTVGVTRGDGTEVVAPGTAATDITVDEFGTYTLDAPDTQELDLLTATWTDGSATHVTQVEIVGGVYFTVAEARAAIGTLTLAKYPLEQVIAVRNDVEDEFEAICGVAFVPRYRRTRVKAGRYRIVLPDIFVRTIRSATTDIGDVLTPYTEEELAALTVFDSGTVTSTWAFPWADTIVEYEHGMNRPPPEVKRAALMRLRERINIDLSGVPSRATSFVAEGGTAFRLDTASATGTGNLDIDAVLDRHNGRDLVAVGR